MGTVKRQPTANRKKKRVDPKVRDALERVGAFYRIGRDSRATFGDQMPYPTPAVRAASRDVASQAERVGLHPEMYRKARQFAAAYGPEDLDRLRAQCERHNYAIGIGHVIRLTSVAARWRSALQREAIEQRWSHSRLEHEIRKRYGNRQSENERVGRRRRAPADKRDACIQVARLCDQWRRLLRSLREPEDRNPRAGGTGDGANPPPPEPPPLRRCVPDKVGQRIVAVDRAISGLWELVAAVLKPVPEGAARRSRRGVRPGRALAVRRQRVRVAPAAAGDAEPALGPLPRNRLAHRPRGGAAHGGRARACPANVSLDLAGVCVDPEAGDLHLRPGAAGVTEAAAAPVEGVERDLDGEERDRKSAMGADVVPHA